MEELLSSLCWLAWQPPQRQPNSFNQSWPWASVANSASYGIGMYWIGRPSLTIHEINCSLASGDSYGEVLEGQLVLSGELIVSKCVAEISTNSYAKDKLSWVKFYKGGEGCSKNNNHPRWLAL